MPERSLKHEALMIFTAAPSKLEHYYICGHIWRVQNSSPPDTFTMFAKSPFATTVLKKISAFNERLC
ncbi:hypothetical protein Bpfe_008689 [Biomphalaria pfeifferi]|uniref:Uncharacterized protein n=1 Tax=Biomphalaria pfeifferi TaxID=112525 RepID=A0AAD8FFZ2_BIOPF|nr:hypothetical protein Bpfe_008689 [Biomphalaria pfeifferi]